MFDPIELPGGFSIVYQGQIQPRICRSCNRDLTKVGGYVVLADGAMICCRCPTDTVNDKPKSTVVVEAEEDAALANAEEALS